MKEAIRLTNRTAIALRKSAQKVRRAYIAAAIVTSIVLGAVGVMLGCFWWLGAVPAVIVLIALIDWALVIASRSRYLSLLGQAICTEAAARELHSEGNERQRREQMEKDLLRMKEDIKQKTDKKAGAQPFFEKKEEEQPEEEDDDLLPETKKPQEEEPRRRRRQGKLELIRSEQVK